MPVELRKRKTPPQPAPAAPSTKKSSTGGGVKGKIAKAKEAIKEAIAEGPGKAAPTENGAITVGSTIDLATFGGEVETNDGEKTTLAKLVEESKSGVVLFTYPKASTPGCTQQVCLFRDSYAPLTATGLSIYGLSADSPKANTTFKTKQNLPYPLLCDTSSTLISAIGFAKKPKGTQRGVFVVDKSGKVLAAEPGGPAATVEVVKRIVDGAGEEKKEETAPAEPKAEPLAKEPSKEEKEQADTAAEVADTAAKIDGAEEAKATS